MQSAARARAVDIERDVFQKILQMRRFFIGRADDLPYFLLNAAAEAIPGLRMCPLPCRHRSRKIRTRAKRRVPLISATSTAVGARRRQGR